MPAVFEELPGGKNAGWKKIDPEVFSLWSKVTHVALYTKEFDSTKQTKVYADIKMISKQNKRNKPAGNEPPKAVTVTFGPDCKTEGRNLDFVRLYYRADRKIYYIDSWGGSDLAGKSVNIPSNDFWIYWHTDGSVCNYYGFDVTSVTSYDGDKFTTGRESALPDYAAEDTEFIRDLTSAFDSRHPHGNYGNNVNKLWHFTGMLDPSLTRAINNDMKSGYGPDNEYIVKDVPGTMIGVEYDRDLEPDDPGIVLPKTGGPGTRAFMLPGSAAMAAAAAILLHRRRKPRRDQR